MLVFLNTHTDGQLENQACLKNIGDVVFNLIPKKVIQNIRQEFYITL